MNGNPETEPQVQYAEGFVFVSVYELDRVFGGHEEGGWYFTAGTLMACRQVLEADADRVKAELANEWPDARTRNERAFQEWVEDGEQGRPPARFYRYDEVNYCGGDYIVLTERKPGADWPEQYPHYE